MRTESLSAYEQHAALQLALVLTRKKNIGAFSRWNCAIVSTRPAAKQRHLLYHSPLLDFTQSQSKFYGLPARVKAVIHSAMPRDLSRNFPCVVPDHSPFP